MYAAEYQKAAARTAKKMPLREAFDHAALGCSSDMGEVASIIKANLVYLKKVDRPELVKELGDVTWFISYGCDLFEIPLTDIVFHREYDHRYMSYHNLDKTAIYWSLMGMKAAGDFAALVAGGCDVRANRGAAEMLLSKLYICVCQVGHKYGIDITEIFDENIAKLRKRYPDAYSDEAAIARVDKTTVIGDKVLVAGDTIEYQHNGLYCSACKAEGLTVQQFNTPSGASCINGHGGADGITLGMEDGTYGGTGDVYQDGGLPTRE